MSDREGTISALMTEDRRYSPAAEFTAHANWSDPEVYQRALEDPEGFWSEMARAIDWFEPWDTVLEWDPPTTKWFLGARVNVSYNCVDRHLKTWRKNKAAIIWEGEPGDTRVLTFQDLHREVNRCAAAMRRLGVQKGDRVALYLGMVPELPIAMLACARLGAPHTVVFGGFSPESLRDRIVDCQAKLLVTADGAWRRGKVVDLKGNADRALEGCPSIENVLVVNRVAPPEQASMVEGRDRWWHDEMEASGTDTVEAESLDSEHPLYILYTSGTTGKPKGLLHTTGGYLVGVHTTAKYVFDLKDDDTYWCAADVGWVTGHSYIVYGPLSNGASSIMYEGAPDFPGKNRFWADHREIPGQHSVHGPHRDPRVHEVGDGASCGPRSEFSAPPGNGGRTHQPGGLGVVPGQHRFRSNSGRRHLVADGDRHDPHHSVAGDDGIETWLGDLPLPRRGSRHRGRGGRIGALGRGRLSHTETPLARHGPDDLG